MKWSWNSGYQAKVPAAVAGKELERLRQKHNDALTPRVVWEENRSRNAPLYKEFEWNDEKCGELWRDNQARSLIRSIRVQQNEDDPPSIQYIHVETDTVPSCYVSTHRILNDEDMLACAIEEARVLVRGAQKRFSFISSLSRIFDEADAKLTELLPKKEKKVRNRRRTLQPA